MTEEEIVNEAVNIIFGTHSFHAANGVETYLKETNSMHLWDEVWSSVEECYDCGNFVEPGCLNYKEICDVCESLREEEE